MKTVLTPLQEIQIWLAMTIYLKIARQELRTKKKDYYIEKVTALRHLRKIVDLRMHNIIVINTSA